MQRTPTCQTVKSLGYITCCSSSSPRPVESPSNSIRHNCLKICSSSRRPKTLLEIRKRPYFSGWSTILLFTSFSTSTFWLSYPNFQRILNWIIQILNYYCRKQHKNIENSQIIEQNVAISLCSSLCLLQLVLTSPSSTTGYFRLLDTVLNVTRDHLCCI